MKYIIQKILIPIGATALGVNGYGQDDLVNLSTGGPVDPANAETSSIASNGVIHVIDVVIDLEG